MFMSVINDSFLRIYIRLSGRVNRKKKSVCTHTHIQDGVCLQSNKQTQMYSFFIKDSWYSQLLQQYCPEDYAVNLNEQNYRQVFSLPFTHHLQGRDSNPPPGGWMTTEVTYCHQSFHQKP